MRDESIHSGVCSLSVCGRRLEGSDGFAHGDEGPLAKCVSAFHTPLPLFLIVKVLLSSSSQGGTVILLPQSAKCDYRCELPCYCSSFFFFNFARKFFFKAKMCIDRKFQLRACLSIFVGFVLLSESEEVDLTLRTLRWIRKACVQQVRARC